MSGVHRKYQKTHMKYDSNSGTRIGHKAKSVILPWSQMFPMTLGKILSLPGYKE